MAEHSYNYYDLVSRARSVELSADKESPPIYGIGDRDGTPPSTLDHLELTDDRPMGGGKAVRYQGVNNNNSNGSSPPYLPPSSPAISTPTYSPPPSITPNAYHQLAYINAITRPQAPSSPHNQTTAATTYLQPTAWARSNTAGYSAPVPSSAYPQPGYVYASHPYLAPGAAYYQTSTGYANPVYSPQYYLMQTYSNLLQAQQQQQQAASQQTSPSTCLSCFGYMEGSCVFCAAKVG